jgi:hypothetical protein
MVETKGVACELTILMPCLNEAETLGTCIRKAQQFLREHAVAGEVLIADNGSTDGSREIAESLGARVVSVPRRGYGAALIGGIVAAAGDYVIMGDADDSYDFADLEPFLAKLREGFDLVMGNRFRGGIRPGAMPFLHRYLGNPVLSTVGRLFFGSPVGDFHSGLRGFRRDAIAALDLRTTGMEFASEMVVKATLNGLRISEVPTILYPDGRTRRPHLRTWSDGWRHLRFLLLYSPRWLFLYPGMALIVFGALASGWLLLGPQRVGGITLDVNTLLYATLAMLIGFQATSFAIFTKVFGISAGLLPDDPGLRRWLKVATLERGLLIGAGMVLAGFLISAYALEFWKARAFGNLDPAQSLRIVVPGVILAALGCQTILSSFFLSILGLERHLT